MSYTNEQWRSAITNLLKKTSTNQIRWESTHPDVADAWVTVDRSLKAEAEGRVYVISQTRRKYYHDEDEFSWRGGFNFSIFEKNAFGEYEKIATAPDISSLSNLFDAAENNLAFNRNALGGLLD